MSLETDRRDPYIIAQEKLARGQTLTEPEKLLLDKFAGNNDGKFDADDLTKMADKRNDKNFLASVGKVGGEIATVAVFTPSISHEHDFSSEGGVEIGETPPVREKFEVAAAGNDIPDTGDNTFTLGADEPDVEQSAPAPALAHNNLSPRGPVGMG